MKHFPTVFLAVIAMVFSGCEEEEVIKSMTVERVTTFDLPAVTPDGEPWDEDETDPDIYIVVKNGDRTLATSEIMRDTVPSAELNFTAEFPVTAEEMREGLFVDVWDDDSGEEEDKDNDFMGSVSFVPEFHADKEYVDQIKEPEHLHVRIYTTWTYE